MNKEQLKKELKKLCCDFRKKTNKDYPKAIMTERQKELNTASINFAGSGVGNILLNEAIANRKDMLFCDDFKILVKKWNLSVSEETTSYKDLIIRIRY